MITPAPRHSLKGNRITAIRWAKFLKELGHKVDILQTYNNEPCDIMIALHAKRSFPSIEQFHKLHNQKPLIVVLTGTDLYKDIHTDQDSQKSLKYADRLVVLQQMGVVELPKTFRSKTRVIYQSATRPKSMITKRKKTFDVCVIGHLRPVKDPFRAAYASKELPASSRVRILQLGAALDDESKKRAEEEVVSNPRYVWLGEQPRWKTRKTLASSQVLVISSQMEGGANVISEAIICGVPILSSKISGSIGMMGKDYPGYFPVGDTKKLADLILRTENDKKFLGKLEQNVKSLAPNFEPAVEKTTLAQLLNEID